jgi:multidrug efflux pump subunit AcrB
MIRWFAHNGIAANFLMVAIFLGGLYTAFFRVPLEVTPSLSWNTVMIEMPYRGATGKDVERAILIPVEEGDKRIEFNGKPALFVRVMRTGSESAIAISNQVHEYVRTAGTRFPDGIQLYVWSDESRSIRGRLTTLVRSMLQGAVLVLLLLGLFLRPMLAFWIILGIPVAFAGGVLLIPWFGITANVMSLFGFILILGIVVDDAIITGENIYAKVRAGMAPFEAAVEGTREVAVPVTFGCLTTMVAFLPLLYFEGTWGDFARQIPPVAAAVLLFALMLSKFCLPAHLKHLRAGDQTHAVARFQRGISRGLERFVERVYQPTLELAVRHRLAVLAGFVALALVMAGYVLGGRMKFVSFPSVDTQRITAILDLPDDTPLETTALYMDRIMAALEQVKREFVDPGTGESLVLNVSRVIGGYGAGGGFNKSRGAISLEIMDPDDRSEPGPRNSQIANRWTELVGPITEARTFRVFAEQTLQPGREYADANLHLELRGPDSPAKAAIAEQIKELLQEYPGITTAWAAINYNQHELEISLRPRAAELGLTQWLLARQIRQAFYGEEAQRVQRGVDDIRVMVRLPREARETLHTLEQLKIRTPSGVDVPLATVAEISFVKAPSFVERNDRAEVIRIGAQPADETVDVIGIAREITPRLLEMCRGADNLSFEFKGHVAEAAEARKRTLLGAAALLLVLYGMLAIPFRSLLQPIYVLLAVPFSVMGALLGHILLGITPSYLSIFGMLALAGVAVNDSLVLVDYINRRRREGIPLRQAALEAGARRFRPILLTSATTFAGLAPLMISPSLHAQFLIPMAVSLGFGVVFATTITLYLVPCALLLAEDAGQVARRFLTWYAAPFRRSGAPVDLTASEVRRPSM